MEHKQLCQECLQPLCAQYPKGCNEYNACATWLQSYPRTKNVMRSAGTYGMKHTIERKVGFYIPMNCLVHAAIDLGFKVERIRGHANFFINISKKALK